MSWIWVVLIALTAIALKYYTAMGERKLMRRIKNAQGAHESTRKRKTEVEQELFRVKQEECLNEERVRFMKERIADLKDQLSRMDIPQESESVESD